MNRHQGRTCILCLIGDRRVSEVNYGSFNMSRMNGWNISRRVSVGGCSSRSSKRVTVMLAPPEKEEHVTQGTLDFLWSIPLLQHVKYALDRCGLVALVLFWIDWFWLWSANMAFVYPLHSLGLVIRYLAVIIKQSVRRKYYPRCWQ